MKQSGKFGLLLFLGLFTCTLSRAQTVEFPATPSEFLPVFTAYLEGADKKEFKDQLEAFTVVWNEGTFEPYRQPFVDLAIEMNKKHLKPIPHYKNYITAVMNFYSSGKPKSEFDLWVEGLKWVLKKKSQTGFNDYLVLSAGLFANNYLYTSTGHTWQASNNNYKFEPVVDNVIITFGETDITCVGRDDKTLLEKTSGTFYPIDEKFMGKGGRIYWDRAGMPKEQVYGDFKNYIIPLNRATFTADSVSFTNTEYFSEPLFGAMEEKLLDVAEGKTSSYPKFDSYTKRFRIEQIFEGIDYEGGFSFYGNKFIASGDSVDLAHLLFYYEGKPLLSIASKSFALEEEKYSSINTSVVFYIEDDSIFHPSVEFKFLKANKEVSLLRIEEGITQKPFTNSYHRVEMFFEALYWKTNESYMRISMVKNSSESSANFRSLSYFSEIDYERLQGLDMVHPMVKMKEHFIPQQKTDFTLGEIAKMFRIDYSEARQLLITYSIAGVINYDLEKETGSLTEKFYSWVNAATRAGDYDKIEFRSEFSGDNAKLSLLDYSMDIKGVRQVLLSDSQNVKVYPLQSELTLKKNRDFDFGGTIIAGRFTIYGQNCHFSYENFKINMEDVDSVVFRVPAFRLNEFGERPLKKVLTSIQDLSGDLLIDSPGNKAGLKPFPTYPTLISDRKSYAYYDGPTIERGVYKRDRFYFQLEPFRIDSLDNFKNTNIRFDGELTSADIFPVIKEKLKVMPDYSLGFEKSTGAEGLPAYGGKGVFTDTISLSNEGLRGRGSLKYLTSGLRSRDMIFYPDSMNAAMAKLNIEKNRSNPETPDVTGEGISAHWEPYKDKYELTSVGTPFVMYGGEAKHYGTIDLTTSSLLGKGKLAISNAEFTSNSYHFKPDNFLADTSQFVLKDVYSKNSDSSDIAFKASGLNANVSFVDRKGKFTFNDPNAYVDFPINKYKAQMNELIWQMPTGTDTESLAKSALDMKGVKFVSTAYNVDTLTFRSQQSQFLLGEKVIRADEVEFVDVADSRIFPIDKKITIRQEAKLDSLSNAKIWVGKELKTHILDNANVNILSLHRYTGEAQYAYIDELGSSQVIRFDSLDVMKDDITFGEGQLEDTKDFSLSSNFGFRGKVNLYGNNQYLTFTGYVKIIHQCAMVTNDYVRFSAELNPKQIMIPVPLEPLNEKNNKLFNGFLFASDSSGLYTAIFTAKRRFTDYEVLAAKGFLYFDKTTQEFVVGSKEKIFDRDRPGNFLAFNTKDCKSYGEGVIDIGAKLGQVTVSSAGNIIYEPTEENTEMDVLVAVDFKLDNTVWKMIADIAGPAGAATFQDDKLKRFAMDLMDSSKAEKTFSEITPEGKLRRLPKELEKALVFGNVNLKWDKTNKSFVHNGQTDLLVLNGNQVMQQVNALIEINRRASGDQVNIYLEFGDNWFFFTYKTNLMQVYSSSKEFNDLVTGLDPAKREFMSDTQPKYQFTISTQRRVDRFKEQYGLP